VKAALLKPGRKPFNFHCFRASAGTFIAAVAPERTRMASGVLHHSRLSTTDKYYIKGHKHQAFRIYQNAVKDIIAKGRRRRSRTVQDKAQAPAGNASRTVRPAHKTALKNTISELQSKSSSAALK
jgi:hypothetical protein